MINKSNRIAAAFFVLIIFVVFARVLFMGYTMQAASAQPGVMPAGPYGKTHITSPIEHWIFGILPDAYWAFGKDPGGCGWQIPAEQRRMVNDLLRGKLPLWNPNQMLGFPLMHNLQLAAFSPLRALFLLPGSQYFADLYSVVLFFISGFGLFLFLRELKLGLAASVIGGLAFMLSGFNIMFQNFTFFEINALMPWELYMAEKLFENPRPAYAGALALFLGQTLLIGYPAPSVLALAAILLYVIFRFVTGAGRKPDKNLFKLIIFFSAALTIGFAIAAVNLLPALRLLAESQNVRPIGMGLKFIDWKWALAGIVPFNGWIPSAPNYLWFGWHGVLVTALALSAVIARKPMPAAGWFFFGLAVFSCLKLAGIAPAQWVGCLPVFNRIMFVRYIHPQLALSMAVLAAFGAEALFRKQVSLKIFSWALFCLAGIVVFLALKGFEELFLQKNAWAVLNSEKIFIGFCMLAALFFIVRKINGFSKAAVMVLVAAELCFYVPQYWTLRYDPFVEAPFVKFLKHQMRHERSRVFSPDRFLYPPYSSAFDLDDIRWMNALAYPHYALFVKSFLTERADDRFIGDEEDLKLFDASGKVNKFLSLLNVKYIISKNRKRFPSPQDIVYDKEAVIFKNGDALPRAFIPAKVIFVKDDKEAIAAMKAPEFDPKETAVIYKGIKPGLIYGKNLAISRSNPSQVKMASYDSDKIDIDVMPVFNGYLVLSDAYSPWWRARIDGKPVVVERADIALRAVPVAAGRHRVEFILEKSVFLAGLHISIAGVILAIAMIFSNIFIVIFKSAGYNK